MAVSKVAYNGRTLIDLTQDTAVESDVASGKYFHKADGTRVQGTASGGGGTVNLQDKTVNLGSAAPPAVSADAGYDGLGTVSFNTSNIDGTKIRTGSSVCGVDGSYEGIIPAGNKDIDTTSQVGVSAYATARISATERAKIIAGNIKNGVTILGVTGNYSGTTPTGTLPITSNGTWDVSAYATAAVNVPIGPVTDLTGTMWIINAVPGQDSSLEDETYTISFTSNGITFPSLHLFNDFTEDVDIEYGTTKVWNGWTESPDPGVWIDQAYRTITITGGTDVTNPDLIAWLTTYATAAGPVPVFGRSINVTISPVDGTEEATLTILARTPGDAGSEQNLKFSSFTPEQVFDPDDPQYFDYQATVNLVPGVGDGFFLAVEDWSIGSITAGAQYFLSRTVGTQKIYYIFINDNNLQNLGIDLS